MAFRDEALGLATVQIHRVQAGLDRTGPKAFKVIMWVFICALCIALYVLGWKVLPKWFMAIPHVGLAIYLLVVGGDLKREVPAIRNQLSKLEEHRLKLIEMRRHRERGGDGEIQTPKWGPMTGDALRGLCPAFRHELGMFLVQPRPPYVMVVFDGWRRNRQEEKRIMERLEGDTIFSTSIEESLAPFEHFRALDSGWNFIRHRLPHEIHGVVNKRPIPMDLEAISVNVDGQIFKVDSQLSAVPIHPVAFGVRFPNREAAEVWIKSRMHALHLATISKLTTNTAASLNEAEIMEVMTGKRVRRLTRAAVMQNRKVFRKLLGEELEDTATPEKEEKVFRELLIDPEAASSDEDSGDQASELSDKDFYFVYDAARDCIVPVHRLKRNPLFVPPPEGAVDTRKDYQKEWRVPGGELGYVNRHSAIHYGLSFQDVALQSVDPPTEIKRALEAMLSARYQKGAARTVGQALADIAREMKADPNMVILAEGLAEALGGRSLMGGRAADTEGGDRGGN